MCGLPALGFQGWALAWRAAWMATGVSVAALAAVWGWRWPHPGDGAAEAPVAKMDGRRPPVVSIIWPPGAAQVACGHVKGCETTADSPRAGFEVIYFSQFRGV